MAPDGNISQVILEKVKNAVIEGDEENASEGVKEALDAGLSPKEILHGGMIAGMNVVGERFKNMEYFLPEVMVSAKAMHACLDILKPLLTDTDKEGTTKIIIGTVQGDLHDIGKNIVAMMLQGAGFEVIDLGTDVAPEVFSEKVRESGARVVCLSSLLTTTMTAMEDVILSLKEAGLREKVKIVVGGAPVTQDYADEIGADGYAVDAATGVHVVKHLLGEA